MDNKDRRIEIIDISLDIDIKEQIKKCTSSDANTTNNINSILQKVKENTMKIVSDCVMEKFEPLFTKLTESKTITKDDFAKFLELQPLMIAPTISKFNKFLKDKGGKFKFVVDKNSAVKQYTLVDA